VIGEWSGFVVADGSDDESGFAMLAFGSTESRRVNFSY